MARMDQTELRRKILGSPIFPFSNTAVITAGSKWLEDFEQTSEMNIYKPFDTVTITNDSSVAIEAYPNEDTVHKVRLPPGVIKTIRDIGGIWKMEIKNIDVTTQIEIAEVEYEVEKRQMDADKFAMERALRRYRLPFLRIPEFLLQ